MEKQSLSNRSKLESDNLKKINNLNNEIENLQKELNNLQKNENNINKN